MTFPHPLLFVPHGVTSWNEAARYQGNTETNFSKKGQTQAAENAGIVASLIIDETLSRKPLRIISSPLQRARQSAAIIADRLGAERDHIKIDSRLRELSVGRREGLNSQEVKDRFYEERKSRKADRWGFKPEGEESLRQRSKDVKYCLQDMEPHSIIVTHAGILRIVSHLLGGKSQQDAAASDIPH